MILIVPCCESQRFNGIKKQFLRLPNNLPLPLFSASGIIGIRRKIFAFIEEDFVNNNGSLFFNQLCLLKKQTNNHVDTVRCVINNMMLHKAPIYVKDCDNYFKALALPNTVTVLHTQYAKFKLYNKGYTKINKYDVVEMMAEKTQISNHVNVGGYGFKSGQMFINYSEGKTCISDVINAAINSGEVFKINRARNYIDYREQDDYDNFFKNNLK